VTGIELVGAPGSGKSVLAAWLAGRMVRDGRSRRGRRIIPADLLLQVPRWPVRSIARFLRDREALALLARHPRVAAMLLDHTPRRMEDRTGGWGLGSEWEGIRADVAAIEVGGPRGDAAYRISALDWLEVTARLTEVARTPPTDVVPLLHEGLVQRSLTVLGRSESSSTRSKMLSMLPADILVVHLMVADDLLVARAMARIDSGLEPDLHRNRHRTDVLRLVLEDAAALARTVDDVAASGVRVLRLQIGDKSMVPAPASLGEYVLAALELIGDGVGTDPT
jgi:hypothetical protein